MLDEVKQHFAVLLVALLIPASRSLKDKRQVIKSIKDKVRNKFNVSASELDDQDKWQVAKLGFAMISCDQKHVEQCLQTVVSFIESFPEVEVTEHDLKFY